MKTTELGQFEVYLYVQYKNDRVEYIDFDECDFKGVIEHLKQCYNYAEPAGEYIVEKTLCVRGMHSFSIRLVVDNEPVVKHSYMLMTDDEVNQTDIEKEHLELMSYYDRKGVEYTTKHYVEYYNYNTDTYEQKEI